jgi:hypothetical protein
LVSFNLFLYEELTTKMAVPSHESLELVSYVSGNVGVGLLCGGRRKVDGGQIEPSLSASYLKDCPSSAIVFDT